MFFSHTTLILLKKIRTSTGRSVKDEVTFSALPLSDQGLGLGNPLVLLSH